MQADEKRTKPSIDLASFEPSARVKQLANYGTMVEVDPNVPPRRYYRSGLEMVRMANVYLAEGSLENAYILYMKFMTLFLEKIRKHPEYATVPAQVKAVNQTKLKEVMPKAEKLKQKLLDQYAKEHTVYLENAEKRKKAEEERRKQESEDAKLAQRLQADENKKDNTHPHLTHTDTWAVSPSAPPVDGVLYPDDFAAEPPRAPSHHYQPVPPLIPPSRPQTDSSYGALCGSHRLRTVVVPAALLPRFLHLAAPSTAANVEMCGILAGKLVVDAISMNIILKYMDNECIDISEYTVSDLHNLIVASDFLQETELMIQIENCLDQQLDVSNCIDIMYTAEQCSLAELEHRSAALALLSFKSMKPEYIPIIDILFWYLSHPSLGIDNEIDVFKFGLDWISHTETGGDALLIILGCLDVKRLTADDLKQISNLIKDHKNSLAYKVVNCLEWLCNSEDVSLETVTTKRSILSELFTERVYTETYSIVRESKERKLKYTPVIKMKRRDWDPNDDLIFTYTDENILEKMIKIPKRITGWSIAAWGNTKLVLVCGYYIKAEGPQSDMKDVMVYDTLRKEWINHGVELPPKWFACAAVLDDTLFIVGGQWNFGYCDTSIVYDLKRRTYKLVDEPPENYYKLCSHKGSMYAVNNPRIMYVYEDSEHSGFWRRFPIKDDNYYCTINCLISFNDYIYCTSKDVVLRRIRPGIDERWEYISCWYSAMCSLKTHLFVFYHDIHGMAQSDNSIHGILVKDTKIDMRYLDESCPLVMFLPFQELKKKEPSKYLQKYLSNYSNVYYKKCNE